MKSTAKSGKWRRRLLRIFFGFFVFVAVLFVVVNLSVTKNWAAQKVMAMLNKDLKSQISFEKIEINYFGNVIIHNVSAKDYKNYNFLKIKEVKANSNWFSLIKNSRNIEFQSLALKELDLKVITYKNDSISNFIRFIDLFDSGKPSTHKTPFELKSGIWIENSRVSIVNQNLEGDAGKWLDAKNFNLQVPELKIKGADINAKIKNFSFVTTRWGKSHFVKTFSAEMALNKKGLFLNDLIFNSEGHTFLDGNIAFNLNNGSWAHFGDKVKIEMKLKKGSEFSGYDLSYFVTDWDNYKPFQISGNFNGTLNNFSLNNFLIHNSDVNIFTQNMTINGLLAGNFDIQTNRISTDFTYQNLKEMLPTFIASKLKNFADDFGRLKYDGSAKITQNQVYIQNGTLISGIGQVKINRFSLDDYSSQSPRYQGVAEVNNLNISAITKTKQIGLLSGKFEISGRGFDLNTMNLGTKFNIYSIDVLGKTINNIYADGDLSAKTYNGLITVNDSEAKATINGLIDFRTSRISADVKADVNYLNISYFTNQKEKQTFSGKVEGKMAMSDLNDMDLDVELNNAVFTNASKKYEIPDGKLKAFIEDENRIISVDMPETVVGKISGKFNLADLAGMFESGLSKILIDKKPKNTYPNQNFTFDFKAEQPLVNLFLPDLKLENGLSLNGSYSGDSNQFVMNAKAEKLYYLMTKEKDISAADKILADANPDYQMDADDLRTQDSIKVDNINLKINTANWDEYIFAQIERVEYNKNILKNFTIKGNNENDEILHFSTNFMYGSPEDETSEKLKNYALKFSQSVDENNDYLIKLDQSDIELNGVLWSIDSDSDKYKRSIIYRRESGEFLAQNLRISSDKSWILIRNAVFKSGKDFDVDLMIRNLDLTKILGKNGENAPDLQGVTNGNIKIKMNADFLEPIVDLKVTEIKMNGKSMGDISINAKNSLSPNIFDVDISVANAAIFEKKVLSITGNIDNNTETPTMDLRANFDDFDLSFANEFVKGIFSNLRGKAAGELQISGPLNNIDYSGDIALKNFGMKLNFTGVDYVFEDSNINIMKGLAVLNNIGIKDERPNSKGSISGIIRFETLSTMGVELELNAENLIVLNNKQIDSDLFWGTVYGKGALHIYGPVSGLNLSTDPQNPFQALENSVFTFNSNSTSGVDEFKMLRFLKRDDSGEITLDKKKNGGANMDVNFMVNVDKGTLVNVLVGDDIGNISVRGTARRLVFNMSRTGNISMIGKYTVENGLYVSTKILNKEFQISKGSNIEWSGDAMSPELNINAVYPNVVNNAGQYLGMNNLPPIRVLLTANITQKLTNPNIELGISPQDVSNQIREALEKNLNKSDDERLTQFGSVLVLNIFNVDNSAFNAGNLQNMGISSGANMALKQLGSVFNTISKSVNFDFDWVGGDDATKTGSRANAKLNFILSQRVTIKTGAGIPVEKSENADQNYISMEGSIEYDWSRRIDGSRLVRFYTKPSNIGMISGNTAMSGGSANQSFGFGGVYNRSFNTLIRRRRPQTPDSLQTRAVKDSVIDAKAETR
ncbi:MAG: translocation/assembly module TamB [Flavobacteriaceae bacterium]|jgi:hypothetical protein|nr:translocation/assembly module TamB [Flavobacteriaceae bacterium]